MKKCLSLLMLSALLVVATLLVTACNPGGGGGAEYSVSFLLDGERVELTEGLVEFQNVPFALYGGDRTIIMALPQAGSLETEPDTYAWINLWGPLHTGNYIFDLEEGYFSYYSEGAFYYSISGSVTVGAAGAVGGAVVGIFSAEVMSEDQITHLVTNGTFRVKRIPDDSLGAA